MLANAHKPMARFDIATFKEPLAGELSSASGEVLLPPVEDDREELSELVVEALFDEESAIDVLPLVVEEESAIDELPLVVVEEGSAIDELLLVVDEEFIAFACQVTDHIMLFLKGSGHCNVPRSRQKIFRE